MSEKLKTVSVLLHLIATTIYGISVYTLLNKGLPPKIEIFGHFKFLTFWDLNFQLITFAIALIVDVFGRYDRSGRPTPLARVLDSLFNSMALPFGIFVCITFWGIYAVDRELIFPVWIEKYFPLWLNHAIHTLILPVVVVENYLVDHRRREQKNGLSLTVLVIIAYTILVLYLGLFREFWVYPVLAVLDWPFRIAFIVGCILVTSLFYFFGGVLYDLAWSSSKRTSSRKRKSGKFN